MLTGQDTHIANDIRWISSLLFHSIAGNKNSISNELVLSICLDFGTTSLVFFVCLSCPS